MSEPQASLHDLSRALRSLQLPLAVDLEAHAPGVAHSVLSAEGVTTADQAQAIAADIAVWRSEEQAPKRLTKLIREVLTECGGLSGSEVAEGYFKAHKRLTQSYQLDFRGAQTLLSSALLIIHLLKQERMSCAQVARVLSSPLRGTTYHWEQIHSLARSLNVSVPTISKDQVESVLAEDRAEQVARYADSTPEVEFDLLVLAATELGFTGDAQTLLTGLVNVRFQSSFLTVLQFMLTVCEEYDHPLTVLYEFRPRGQAFEVLQQANPNYADMGNAALNIAKAAPALNRDWAWGKKSGSRGDALLLAELLMGMEDMHYPARREFASWLRQWIVRIQRRQGVQIRLLAEISDHEAVISLLRRAAGQETNTYGIVEQRMVDACAAFLHPSDEWIRRGLCDAVNASNLAKKKLGDCEFISRGRLQIDAYEAHAGVLTDSYIEAHKASFERVLESRCNDLEARAPAPEWQIRVTFVANRVDASSSRRVDFEDFSADFVAITYEEIVGEVEQRVARSDSGPSMLTAAMNSYFVDVLNERRVDQPIRDRVAEVLGCRLVTDAEPS